MTSGENAGKVTEDSTLPCPICRNGASSNSIIYHFSRCWAHKKCSDI